MFSEEHITELLPAYALDCLDENETELVSKHLSTCPACRAELRAYQAVSDQLALATPQAEPPAWVKEKLMNQVQASSKRAFGRTGEENSFGGRIMRFFRSFFPVWAPVSLVIIVALVASNLLLWQKVRSLGTAPQPVAMRVINLSGTQAAPGATGLVVVSLDGEHGTLVVDHLPTLNKEWQYQLWLIKEGQRTSGGVFSVSKDGYGSVWVHSPNPLASYTGFGVTVEPAGGSPGPTGEKVLGGSF